MGKQPHTAGPWQVRDDYTPEGRVTIIGNVDGEYDAYGVAQCTYDTIAICEDGFGETLPNATANARLITAAPELLAALKLAVEHIEHMAAWIARNNRGYSFEALGEDMPAIKAPIAKASGADS